MKTILALLFALLASYLPAEPLGNFITIDDGLDLTSTTNIQDDYIRLYLLTPNYTTMAKIQTAIKQWLGPDMTSVRNQELILVQAPRDAAARVNFISALTQLEIEN